MSVRHIFLWSVRDGYDGDEVLAKLADLEKHVPDLVGWSIGRHEGETPNSSSGKWEYALTVDFADFEALNVYQHHPAHRAVIDEVMESYEDWVVLDYVLD